MDISSDLMNEVGALYKW